MMYSKKLTSIVVFSFLASCAGSVETLDGGDGDGDGDGDGLGPIPGDGDGDYVLPGVGGRIIGDGDGDLIYPPGVGGWIIGDGDGDLIYPPGVGGANPMYPTPSGGTGGVMMRPPGTGGGPNIPVTPIDPAGCTNNYQYTDGRTYCEKQVSCPTTDAYVWCDAYSGTGQCSCDRSGQYFSVSIDQGFFSGGAGCDRMMDACLGGGELEVVGEKTCSTTYLDQYANSCGTNYTCQTPVDVGGAVGSIQEYSEAWCENYSGQWVCNCYTNNTSSVLTYVEAQSSPNVCIDTISICGEAAFDPNVSGSCAPRSQWADRNQCNFDLECSQERALNGQRVEVSQWRSGYCLRSNGDLWECSCGDGGPAIGVTSASGWDACSSAAATCAL